MILFSRFLVEIMLTLVYKDIVDRFDDIEPEPALPCLELVSNRSWFYRF